MRYSLIRIAIVAIVVCALVPRRAAIAQVATTIAPSRWTSSTQVLGIENFRCDCTITSSSDSRRRFVFRSEPTVLGVIRRGPSYGILYRGDVITHVDGYSILSTEGARRFSSIEPGDDVDLTFKRNGKTMKASIHAKETEASVYVLAPEAPGAYSIGWDVTPTPAIPATPPTARTPAERAYSIVTTPRPPKVAIAPMQPSPAVPAVPAAPGAVTVWPTVPAIPAIPAVPRGWFGFSIRCNGCGWVMSPGETPVWESDEPPELAMVAAGSPAGRAGLRAGDRLTHIDGLSLLTHEGARRFGRVRPGERVRLTLKRGNATLTRELTLLSRPEVRAAMAAASPRAATTVRPSLRRELRYTGELDNVSVEVWSTGGPTVEKVGDTMVITTGSSVVRIKVDPRKARD